MLLTPIVRQSECVACIGALLLLRCARFIQCIVEILAKNDVTKVAHLDGLSADELSFTSCGEVSGGVLLHSGKLPYSVGVGLLIGVQESEPS